MKITVNIARFIVGVLFIFSGLVKANDPLGLSYKMEEFFEIWNAGLGKSTFFIAEPLMNLFSFLHGHSLFLAVIMIAFEIIAGAALLLGWRMRLFGWLLLLLIIFFTFLTGYALFSGKFKNCGCFGDCIPITPKTSFLKDVILTVLIGFLFWQRRNIRPLFSERATALSMLAVTLLSFGIQWYTLTYLPFADCLPFRKGNNINEQMKMPANAVPDSTVITFVYKKDGKEIEFTADKFPADFSKQTYTLVKRYDKVIRKGSNNEPPIKGFSLSGTSESDSTQVVLNHPYAVLLFCENFDTPVSKWKKEFEKIFAEAKAKNIPAYVVTTQPGAAQQALSGTAFSGIQVFKSDYTAIRTAARTNPCLYLLKMGTVVNKWSYKKMNNALTEIKKIPVQQATIPDAPVIESPSGN
jgi:uncharacterized membrane protein YphA (DoxX/SURF4 family)